MGIGIDRVEDPASAWLSPLPLPLVWDILVNECPSVIIRSRSYDWGDRDPFKVRAEPDSRLRRLLQVDQMSEYVASKIYEECTRVWVRVYRVKIPLLASKQKFDDFSRKPVTRDTHARLRGVVRLTSWPTTTVYKQVQRD